MPDYDIDLTLDSFMIPAISTTFPFGTKVIPTVENKGGLSTFDVNSNVMLPFTRMRPRVCSADSVTSPVEYDAKIVFSAPQGTTPASGYTLTLGTGDYVGCTVTFTNLLAHACTVRQSDGTTTLFSVPAGKTMSAMWNGTAWLWTTTGSVTANDPTPVSSAAVHAAIGEVVKPNIITNTILFEPAGGVSITRNVSRLIKISDYLYQLLFEPLEFSITSTGAYLAIGTFSKTVISGKSTIITAENVLGDSSNQKFYDCYIENKNSASLGLTVRSTVEAGSHSLCGSILLLLKD